VIRRTQWLDRIEQAWSRRSIVWLSGVRRAGKTTLARMLPGATYLNFDLPSTGRMLADPELFLDGQPPGATLIFDEVHRLADPSRLLKIAADAFPRLRVLATGSSTLAATRKFRDALTGRKATVHLFPVLWSECADWLRAADLDRRLLHGGLPESLLAARKQPEFFAEWLDSFYARDVQELFGVRNRRGFLALLRLLLRRSGGQLDYGKLAAASELSRPTAGSYVEALSIAHAVHLVRPFHAGGAREIVRRPKCYAFDTGFVTCEKGWDRVRDDDRGLLWEHLVLDTLRARFGDAPIFYWRDKSHREVDFVIRRTGDRIDLVECKINPGSVEADAVRAFRSRYPAGNDYVVSPAVKRPYRLRRGDRVLTACAPQDL